MRWLAAIKAAMRSAPAETGALHLAGSKAMPSTSIWKTITEEISMTRKLPKRGLPPMHPGELLREEILPALDRSKTEIARLLGVSRQTLYDVLKEKQPVTPVMALRLGKLCGNGPDLWHNLQKYFRSRPTQITSISAAVSPHRGAYRDRHGRGAGCGGRGSVGRCQGMAGRVDTARELTNGTQTNDAFRGRQSRVVLAPVAGVKSEEASRPDRV